MKKKLLPLLGIFLLVGIALFGLFLLDPNRDLLLDSTVLKLVLSAAYVGSACITMFCIYWGEKILKGDPTIVFAPYAYILIIIAFGVILLRTYSSLVKTSDIMLFSVTTAVAIAIFVGLVMGVILGDAMIATFSKKQT